MVKKNTRSLFTKLNDWGLQKVFITRVHTIQYHSLFWLCYSLGYGQIYYWGDTHSCSARLLHIHQCGLLYNDLRASNTAPSTKAAERSESSNE